MNTYKILVTGVSISGKSNLARMLEIDFSEHFLPITNKDVDWDKDALIVPQDSRIYILQTPKGCKTEAEHGILLTCFDKILYSDPDMETYTELLASRGCAWFKEGVVEKGLDIDPEPSSLDKLSGIFGRILGYALKKEKLRSEDMAYFKRANLMGRVVVLKPAIENKNYLSFEGYPTMLEQIVEEVRSKQYDP